MRSPPKFGGDSGCVSPQHCHVLPAHDFKNVRIIHAKSLQTVMLGIGQDPMDIVADENYVWVSNGFNKLTRIPTGAGPIREFEVELAGQYQEPLR